MIQLQRIVPKNLINQLQLQKFQVGFIEAKYANKVIQILKGLQTLPIQTFFLKRIRKNKDQKDHPVYVQVLLCLSQQKQQFIEDIEKAFQQSFDQNIIKQIVTLQLPRFAPACKKDFQQWTKLWPCNFIEPEFVKKIEHSKEQLVIVQELFKVSIDQPQTNSLYLFEAEKYLIHFEGKRQQFSCKNKNPLLHPIIKATQKWPQSKVFKQNQSQYYYLTGLRMLVKSDKLCGMCAMGLVHSRIQRLYFEENSVPSQQILQILYSQKLNHKIELVKVKLKAINKEKQL